MVENKGAYHIRYIGMENHERRQAHNPHHTRRYAMKRIVLTAITLAGLCLAASAAQAGWGTCSGCHNGTLAINKDAMLAKYTSVEAFIKGAQAVENPMMSRMKQDIEGLKAAAAELGLKPEQEKR